jgi:hypothetical protein
MYRWRCDSGLHYFPRMAHFDRRSFLADHRNIDIFFIQRTISSNKRRKLDVDGTATRGIWSIALRSNDSTSDKSITVASDAISTRVSTKALLHIVADSDESGQR